MLFFLAFEDTIEKDLAALAGDQAFIVLRISWLFGLFLGLERSGETASFTGYSGLTLTVDVLAESASSLYAAGKQIYLGLCMIISNKYFPVVILIDELLLGQTVVRLLRFVSLSFLETLLQPMIESLQRLLLKGIVGYLQKQIRRHGCSEHVLPSH